jgi:hypothetical protein
VLHLDPFAHSQPSGTGQNNFGLCLNWCVHHFGQRYPQSMTTFQLCFFHNNRIFFLRRQGMRCEYNVAQVKGCYNLLSSLLFAILFSPGASTIFQRCQSFPIFSSGIIASTVLFVTLFFPPDKMMASTSMTGTCFVFLNVFWFPPSLPHSYSVRSSNSLQHFSSRAQFFVFWFCVLVPPRQNPHMHCLPFRPHFCHFNLQLRLPCQSWHLSGMSSLSVYCTSHDL